MITARRSAAIASRIAVLPEPQSMKLVSFNINGLRARPHQLSAIIEKHQPDVIGLQETKVSDEQFPQAEIKALGYHVHFHGQKGHYGVALLSRQAPLEIHKGFPGDGEESQKRFIWGRFADSNGEPVTVMNGYFPQGESRIHPTKFPAKTKFYADLQALLEERFTPEQSVAVMGDFNISPEDCDIGIGEVNAKRWLRTGKCSFLPEEREWLTRLKNWGLQDSFRTLNPEVVDRFSWFDYRSRGFEDDPRRGLRIDLILTTAGLHERVTDCGVDYDIRSMEKPSDHCPVWIKLGQ
jgi:exodeoxyribonuclease-3